MVSVEVTTKLSTDELLKAVQQLPAGELNKFIRQVIALQAQRGERFLDDDEEAALLNLIQADLALADRNKLDTLRAKSRETPLTPVEQAELLQLVQQVEQQNVIRVKALVELAQKRNVTLGELMVDLGLEAKYA